MDLQEIISRDLTSPMEQSEALFVIKKYIKARKDIDVEPEIFTNQNALHILGQLKLMQTLVLHAIVWFKSNPNQIS